MDKPEGIVVNYVMEEVAAMELCTEDGPHGKKSSSRQAPQRRLPDQTTVDPADPGGREDGERRSKKGSEMNGQPNNLQAAVVRSNRGPAGAGLLRRRQRPGTDYAGYYIDDNGERPASAGTRRARRSRSTPWRPPEAGISLNSTGSGPHDIPGRRAVSQDP